MIFLSADVGGTFTDLVLIFENQVFFDKVPSTPGSTKAVLNGINRITTKAGISKDEIGIFVHGFTIATNAFLTRNGATISLAVSKGYRDTLEIGNQRRPHLYHMTQVKPKPVVPRSRIIEVVERLDAFGNTVIELSNAEATEVAKRIANENPEAIAICLSFAYLCSNSEEFLRKQLKIILPAVPIYISSEINSQVGEYKRANTTAIAAYIGPITDKYVEILANDLVENGILAPLRLMRSDGGVATPQAARENPVTMLLSGLAGGVIAGEAMASELDVDNLVTFDMGGTSADFSVIVDGEPRRVNEREINGQPIRMQSLDIETISAGGGSLAHIDLGGALRVGPQSAGALPGPACYGTGGEEPTTTDAIVALGILDPDSFLGGELKLDADLAISAITRKIAKPLKVSVTNAALGIVRVANAGMIQAIRKLSVERGLDIREFSLLAFGGAGPIYAPFLARELGMKEVLVPFTPGVYAAQGLLMTDIRHTTQASWFTKLETISENKAKKFFSSLKNKLSDALQRDGIFKEDRYFKFYADLRCEGQFHDLTIELSDPTMKNNWSTEEIKINYYNEYERRYGHSDRSIELELISIRTDAYGRTPKPSLRVNSEKDVLLSIPSKKRSVCLDEVKGFEDVSIIERHTLNYGDCIEGPAVITQSDATTLVLHGQTASVISSGILRITEQSQSIK